MRRMIVALLVLGVGVSVVLHRSAKVKASVSAGSALGYRAAHHNNYGVNNDNGMVNHSVERPPAGGTHLGSGTVAHQRMKEAGVGWVRHWISWEVVEGTPGVFHWDVYDHDINAAIEQGMNVYITLQGAPAWPHGGKQTYHWGQCDGPIPDAADFDGSRPDCGPLGSPNAYAPFDPGLGNGQSYHWKRFVTEAVRRYGDRVKYWGFWNEPANQWYWPEYAEPPYHSRAQQLVAKVLKPGREAALAANPSVVIVGPEDNSTGSLDAFLGLEQNGIPVFGVPPYGRLFDVISIHVYNTSPGGMGGAMDDFKAVIDNYRRREVWLTETNGDAAIASALENFFVRGWLSKVFIFGMRGSGCGNLNLLDDFKNPCPSYAVYQFHLLSQNQPAMHFAGTSGVAGHNDFVLLQNPHPFTAGVTLRFANTAGSVITQGLSMSPNSRTTVHVASAGHPNAEQAVTVVPQTPYLPIWAEHADYWNGGEAGRLSQGTGERSDSWYFAEGVTGGGFWVHDNTAYNPSLVFSANITWTFLNTSGSTVGVSHVVPPQGSHRVRVNDVPGVEPEQSTIVSARWSGGPYHNLPAPIAAERTITWGGNIEGHSSRGVPFPSPTWYFADGNQSGGWATYLLLGNPTFNTANVEVSYMTTGGLSATYSHTVGPRSRLTVIPPVSGQFGIIVKSVGTVPVPIVAERAMYFGAGWTVGTVTEGTPYPSQRWLFPEGSTEGMRFYDPYILLANPTAQNATVRLNFHNGGPLVWDIVNVPPFSRITVSPWGYPALQNVPFSTEVIVQASPGIVPPGVIAERGMYWSGTTGYYGGHSAMGLY